MQKKEVFIFGSAFSLYQLVIKRDKFWRSFYLWLSSPFYCEFVGDQPNGENLLSPSRTWLRFKTCSILFLQPHLRNLIFCNSKLPNWRRLQYCKHWHLACISSNEGGGCCQTDLQSQRDQLQTAQSESVAKF